MDIQILNKKLLELFDKDQILTAKEELACYSYDSSLYTVINHYEPDGVVLAKCVEDVVKVINLAQELKLPVIPRGAGTGQVGGATAPTGGICLDLSSWKDIEELLPDDSQVFIRPGITLDELNKAVAPYGLYLPPDPSSSSVCTLGGMVSNNCAGQRSLKYGPTSSYVIGLEVVLPTGEVITLGGQHAKVIKSVSGLDLKTGLFVGSEGILGVITGIRLRLANVPPTRRGILLLSSDKREIPVLTREIYRNNVVLSACEFTFVQPSSEESVCSQLHGVNLPSKLEFVLLLEFEGNEPSTKWELETTQKILAQYAGTFISAENKEEMERLWFLLDEAEGGVVTSRPGAKRMAGGEDIVVPPSKLIVAIDGIQQLVKEAGVSCVNFGHVAFGHIHTGLLIKPADAEEMKRVKSLIDHIHLLALELNGSTTGEHGTGLARSSLLQKEHGAAVKVMQKVKNALDPDNICNPGKILSVERG